MSPTMIVLSEADLAASAAELAEPEEGESAADVAARTQLGGAGWRLGDPLPWAREAPARRKLDVEDLYPPGRCYDEIYFWEGRPYAYGEGPAFNGPEVFGAPSLKNYPPVTTAQGKPFP